MSSFYPIPDIQSISLKMHFVNFALRLCFQDCFSLFFNLCLLYTSIRSFLKKRMSANGTGLFRADNFRIGRKEYGVGNTQPEAAGLLLRKKRRVKQPWKQRLIRHPLCVKIWDACFHPTDKRLG